MWALVAWLSGGVTTAVAVAIVIYYRGKYLWEKHESLLAAGDAASARGALEAEKARAREREGVLLAEIEKQRDELALRDKERLDALSQMAPKERAAVAASALRGVLTGPEDRLRPAADPVPRRGPADPSRR